MRRAIKLGLLLYAFVFAAAASEAAVWTFNQGGWSPGLLPPTGGVAIGFFEGTDDDGDGLLELSEVTGFLLEFSGDSVVQDFQHEKNDLKFFKFTIGTKGFPPSFPFFSENGLFSYDADDGTIGINVGSTSEYEGILSTFEPMRVTLIPVPTSFPLLAVGLFGLATIGRRRKLP